MQATVESKTDTVAETSSTAIVADLSSARRADCIERAGRAGDVADALDAARRRAIAALFRRKTRPKPSPLYDASVWRMKDGDPVSQAKSAAPSSTRSRLGDALRRLEDARQATSRGR